MVVGGADIRQLSKEAAGSTTPAALTFWAEVIWIVYGSAHVHDQRRQLVNICVVRSPNAHICSAWKHLLAQTHAEPALTTLFRNLINISGRTLSM